MLKYLSAGVRCGAWAARIGAGSVLCYSAIGFALVVSTRELLANNGDAVSGNAGAKRGAISPSFLTEVVPVLGKFGCNSIACHGSEAGKGNLKLSLFGGDPSADFDALAKSFGGRFVNRVEPEKSLLLLKPSGALPHAGAKPVPAGSPQYRALLDWIARGALPPDAGAPHIVSLDAATCCQILRPGETARIALAARFSDGSREDTVRDATFLSTDRRIASVDADGLVKAGEPGEAVIIASYFRKPAVVRIVVPRPVATPLPDPGVANKIDELVNANLKVLGIPAAALCSDEVFLRRVYLQTTGLPPRPLPARKFLEDTDPQKRAKLIDRLLSSGDFAEYRTLQWGDILRIKSEYPVKLWPKAVETYRRWLRQNIDQPYDVFVRKILLSGGSNFYRGEVNFFRSLAFKDPRSIGENAALVFMGARFGCAHCHVHPLEDWSEQDTLGLGAFFARVGYKNTLEWKEEVVYFNPKGVLRDPRTNEVVKPKLPGGPSIDLAPDEDPRIRFATWLTAPDNPWFSQAIANRIWFWLFSRGLVNEPDDMRPTNPAENPELLDFLAREVVANKYDLKHLYRLILNSRTWQRTSVSASANASDAAHFAHFPVVRMGAESLSDAVCQITENFEKFQSIIPEPFTFLPTGHRATQIADGNIAGPFLELFGRPPRDTPFQSERNNDTSLWQALYLLNSDQLEGKVAGSPRIKRMIEEKRTDEQIVEEFYLAALSRLPTAEEKRKVTDYLTSHKANRTQSVRDLVWALINTKEFMFIR